MKRIYIFLFEVESDSQWAPYDKACMYLLALTIALALCSLYVVYKGGYFS